MNREGSKRGGKKQDGMDLEALVLREPLLITKED